MAQRNGIATQIAARQAIVIAMSFDTHLELVQSRFSISLEVPATGHSDYSMRLRICLKKKVITTDTRIR